MINKQTLMLHIEKIRKKLNEQIEIKDSYENILKTSFSLDKLINKYYQSN